jgi:hypothetical protein
LSEFDCPLLTGQFAILIRGIGHPEILTWTKSRLRVQLRVNNSRGFDAKSVVYRYSQTLLAANVAFCGLHRDMPKKKLDLLEFASRIMTESRTGPPEIMGRETWNVHARRSLLDDVPHCLF